MVYFLKSAGAIKSLTPSKQLAMVKLARNEWNLLLKRLDNVIVINEYTIVLSYYTITCRS